MYPIFQSLERKELIPMDKGMRWGPTGTEKVPRTGYPPIKPKNEEPLLLYLAVTTEAVGSILLTEVEVVSYLIIT